MSTSSTDHASGSRESFIDEQAIAVLRLPPNAHPLWSPEPCFLALVRDAGRPWRCLMSQTFDWPHSGRIIRTACEERAVLTVDGKLRVGRRRVKPEAYLRGWRRAIERASDITRWRTLDSVRPVARFEIDAEVLKNTRSRRRDPVYPDLPSLLKAVVTAGTGVVTHIPSAAPAALTDDNQAVHNGNQPVPACFGLAIDLTKPDGACHAWWTQDLISSIRYGDANGRSSSVLEMARLDVPSVAQAKEAQLALFEQAFLQPLTSQPAKTPTVA